MPLGTRREAPFRACTASGRSPPKETRMSSASNAGASDAEALAACGAARGLEGRPVRLVDRHGGEAFLAAQFPTAGCVAVTISARRTPHECHPEFHACGGMARGWSCLSTVASLQRAARHVDWLGGMDEARVPHVVHIYSLANYGFGQKPERQARTKAEQLLRMQERHGAEGARRTVEAVLLVNEHRHPHVLLLQVCAAAAAARREYRVPYSACLSLSRLTRTHTRCLGAS